MNEVMNEQKCGRIKLTKCDIIGSLTFVALLPIEKFDKDNNHNGLTRFTRRAPNKHDFYGVSVS